MLTDAQVTTFVRLVDEYRQDALVVAALVALMADDIPAAIARLEGIRAALPPRPSRRRATLSERLTIGLRERTEAAIHILRQVPQ